MGEYAEMLLDGTCCEGCGAFLEGTPSGIPSYCSPECDPRTAPEGHYMKPNYNRDQKRQNMQDVDEMKRRISAFAEIIEHTEYHWKLKFQEGFAELFPSALGLMIDQKIAYYSDAYKLLLAIDAAATDERMSAAINDPDDFDVLDDE